MRYLNLTLVVGLTVLVQLVAESRLIAQPAGFEEPIGHAAIGEKQTLLRFEFSAPSMGSHVDFVVYAPSQAEAKNVIDAGLTEIERLSTILSNYDPDSEISKLCSAPKGVWTSLSADLAAVLKHSRRWHELSAGKFDITVGPLTRLWRAHRKKKQLPPTTSIEDAKRRCGWSSVDLVFPSDSESSIQSARVSLLKDQMVLDLSGIAVGYIVDAAFEKMRGAGSRSILINAGGDIRVGDAPPGTNGWRIAIAGLGKESPPLSMIQLKNCAITTSGDLNQFVEIDGRRYSHFIDPESGDPIERRQSVTVMAETTVDADAGATALAVLGMQRASELFDAMPITKAVLVESGMADGPSRLRCLEKTGQPYAE
jgi:FAD:protein FMN transferase